MKVRFALDWHAAGDLKWLQWEGGGVTAAFPGREGGVSPAPFESLNLGLSVDDDAANVLENRRRLCAALGVPQERLVVPGQVHGTTLAWVADAEAGRGAHDRETVIHDHDGLLTATHGLGLVVSYADCVPVVIAARGADGPELAVVHAGWRGMLAGIVGQAAGQLAGRGRLLGAVVGPSIGPCCFTVDEALRERFQARFPGCTGERAVDLWACAGRDLEAAGVPPGAVTVTGLCTMDDGRFFSHRGDHGSTGRHLAIAWRQEG
jgi:YfiH family protein